MKKLSRFNYWKRIGISIALVAAGLLYVMYPLDLLPDKLHPVIGYMDDALAIFVAGWILHSAWQSNKGYFKKIFS